MSIPTNNLYDFVHQVTKRKFWMVYFDPWGSRELTDLVEHYQHLTGSTDNKIPWENRIDKNIFSPSSLNMETLRSTQPILFCYDQEPLMFDYYAKNSDAVNKFFNKMNFNYRDLAPDLNLKWFFDISMQKYLILLHSELNSPEVEKYENTGMFKTAFWWSHAMIALDWYRFAKYDSSLYANGFEKLFLIYCRDHTGYREYRKNFLNLLNVDSLNEHCLIPSLNSNISADASATYVSDDFNSTAFSVVLETVFDQRIHLTEKILRPIACGHPFIVAAGPGTLDFLKRYGFKTFAPFVNETYDTIADSDQRLVAIVNEMRRLSKLTPDELSDTISKCREIAEHNKKVFFSNDFQNQIIGELTKNVDQAFDQTGNQIDFEQYWKIRRLNKKIGFKPLKTGFRREAILMLRQQRLANRAR